MPKRALRHHCNLAVSGPWVVPLAKALAEAAARANHAAIITQFLWFVTWESPFVWIADNAGYQDLYETL